MSDRTSTDEAPLQVRSAAAVGRAVPSLALVLLADAAVIWAAWAGGWSVLAVVLACVIDGLADGLFAWLRARASFAAGSATDTRDQVLVREFIKTYLIVVGAQALIAYMVFSGMLLKPGGEAPVEPGAAFVTWQFWAVVGGLVVARAFMYWWDFVRGGEADVIPPEAAVAEPLRRLFVLQFGMLAGGLRGVLAVRLGPRRPRGAAGGQDGRRPRAGRPRAPARGAYHGGRGGGRRAARLQPHRAAEARPAGRPQAPPVTRRGRPRRPRRPRRRSCLARSGALWYRHTTMRYVGRSPPGATRVQRRRALPTSGLRGLIAPRVARRSTIHRSMGAMHAPTGRCSICEGVLEVSAQERETANVGAGLWKATGMWAWILFRISGLVLVVYLFVHISVISPGRVARASTLDSFLRRSTTRSWWSSTLAPGGGGALPRAERRAHHPHGLRDRHHSGTRSCSGSAW